MALYAARSETHEINYKFCFECGRTLAKNDAGLLACRCGWVHYNNPKPVVAGLIPVGRDFGYLLAHPEESAIVMTQRAIEPFAGGWCWPSGYVNEGEDPLDAVVREVYEETGLEVDPVFLFDHRNPMPGKLNQIVSMYLCRSKGGIMRRSSETLDVRAFGRHDRPSLCFSTHEMFTKAWFAGEVRGGVVRNEQNYRLPPVRYGIYGLKESPYPETRLTRVRTTGIFSDLILRFKPWRGERIHIVFYRVYRRAIHMCKHKIFRFLRRGGSALNLVV